MTSKCHATVLEQVNETQNGVIYNFSPGTTVVIEWTNGGELFDFPNKYPVVGTVDENNEETRFGEGIFLMVDILKLLPDTKTLIVKNNLAPLRL